MNQLRILMVDDEDIIRKEMRSILSNMGFLVYDAALPSAALAILEQQPVDIAIVDVRMPEMSGIELLRKIKSSYPYIEVIIITGHGDETTILEALREGAFDYFRKPVRGHDIAYAIERTRGFLAMKQRLKIAEEGLSILSEEIQAHTGVIVGRSAAITQAISLTLKASASATTPILIYGPSGSGKELIARVIHYAGARKNHVFCVVNSSAIPETLLESEFFGYTKGAFTGAAEDRPGIFERADGGTLFLDEIGDMPVDLQAKLLRAIENKTITRVGSGKEISVDVRIVAATNKNLREMVAQKQFREDLYYRLNTLEIDLPPLRNRKEDIPALVEHYIHQFAKELKRKIMSVDPEVMLRLADYDFPGNVRELKNMCERAVLLCESDVIRTSDFAFDAKRPAVDTLKRMGASADVPLSLQAVDELEKKIVIDALKRAMYVKSNAAKLLSISRQSLDWLIKKHGIILQTDVAGT
ncbi:MAG: sigma-54-dependent Fis family transcriptional regulator [Spirochaetes bacterium]|nr:sigma-54-dependent Fis family transcriptional regulator [Spirochaetota bacterium]